MQIKIDTHHVIQELNDKGVLVIDSFISGPLLQELNHEFHKFLNSENIGASFTPYSAGKCARVKRDEYIKTDFPAMSSIFYSELFQKLSENYLGSTISLNEELFIVKDVVGSKHIANDLHYDVIRTFKFFIYLTDTTKENGAFSCVPGSHKKTAEYRASFNDKISYENRDVTRELDLDTFSPAIPIEGKAGTLIIFDTDVWHQAGLVSTGERHVIRGHTRVSKNEKSKSKQNLLSKIKKLYKK